MSTSNSTRSSRSENACESCRKRKIKCSGTHPCSSCHRRGRECHFESNIKRSESYIRGLLQIIEDQKRELAALSNDPFHTKDEVTSPTNEVATSDNDDATTPIQELAPGPVFESRMRTILRDHADRQRPSGESPENLTFENVRLPDRPVYEWRSAVDLVENHAPPMPLSKTESSRLVDLFVSQMGIDQHFLDPRAFYDAMTLLYKDEYTRKTQMQSIWFIQYLLIMGLGMLISSPSTESGRAPGCTYFAEAMRRLPPTYQLGSHGIISVEILCLITLYLQWRDRKHEAYVHIGLAIRLAIALGCTLPLEEQDGLPSEICHRTRVWWTAYMLDRRLSAGLGFPTGADDRQLRAELPQPSAGFQPPLPLIINIQIAQVTGDIMTSFYGNSKIPQSELYQRIQDTLQTLAKKGRSIPPGYVIDFSQPNPVVSRTSATLYLMLFQAIILCTRPFVLHRVKEKVEACKRNDASAPTASPLISRLCKACKEAASKSVKILTSLRKQKIITLFGYFDLDATFSTAIVIMMMGFIDTNDSQKPPENLEEAVGVLQYLAAAGNTAADRRLTELKQFCRHVWSPAEMSEEWKWLGLDTLDQSTEPGDLNFIAPTATVLDPNAVGEVDDEVTHNNFWPETWDTWDNRSSNQSPEDPMAVDTLNFNMDNSLEMDFTPEAANIYSSFNDPSLPLTGVNEFDWTEIGKMFKGD